MPRFSIVIPTTRSHLLRYSVGSVLAQSFRDFEIIVSDNQASDVAAALRSMPDDRIRHVRTPRRLPAHESWEFGLASATGDWILLLCDDDSMLPCLLEELSEVLASTSAPEVVTWRHASFVALDFPDPQRRGRIDVPPFNGRGMTVDNRETLADLFALGGDSNNFAGVKRRQPYPTHSAYKRELVSRIRTRAGALFLPTTPDYAAITSTLVLCPRTFILDKPLTVLHSTADSNAAAAAGDSTTVEATYAEFTHELFQFVPFKGRLSNRNSIADTIFGMKQIYQVELASFSLNPVSYLKFIYLGLDQIKQQAGNSAALVREIADFRELIEMQSDDIKLELRRFLELVDTSSGQFKEQSPLRIAMRWWHDIVNALILQDHARSTQIARSRVRKRGLSTNAAFAHIGDILDFAGRLDPIVAH